MLKTQLLIALRTLRRRPGTTLLHIGGLAIGLTCCFLATLYVLDELAFDRFHEEPEHIVQITQAMTFGDQTLNLMSAPEEALDVLRTEVPGVVTVAMTNSQGGLVRHPQRPEGLPVEEIRFADAAFLELFTFPFLQGDPATALEAPNQTVLTESLARTLFGDTNPIGETITIERTGFGLQDPEPIPLTVSGIAQDPPANSTFRFELLVSGATPVATFDGSAPALSSTNPMYVRVQSLADTVGVKAAVDRILDAQDGHSFGTRSGSNTMPLLDAHRGSGQDGLGHKPLYLVLLSAIAALILLLACVNYANLATALAVNRAPEVGVRKTFGAGRGQLTRQFLMESLLLAIGAGLLALALSSLALPTFNAFFDKGITWEAIDLPLLAMMVGITLGAGLLAGFYPAFMLSRFRPALVLKGLGMQGRGSSRVRQGLVVFQFTVTAVLLASTVIIVEQLQSIRTRDLGFDGDQAVMMNLQAQGLSSQRDVFKSEMAALPGVRRVSLGSTVPGDLNTMVSVSPPGTPDDRSDDMTALYVQGDEDYAETLGLRLRAGTWFSDSTAAASPIVINETAARTLGLMTTDPSEALGVELGEHGEVVGVVEDFLYSGIRGEINPVVLAPAQAFMNTTRVIVQLDAADAPATLAALEGVWKRLAPSYAFDPLFVDDLFAEKLRADRKLGQVFGTFSLIAVLLACLGLFGLAAYAAERRTKEIGVRKTLGASVTGLVAMLSTEFIKLVVLALVVAAPVTVLLARYWLADFAYPAPIRALPLIGIGLGMLGVALFTVSLHTVRAATMDPVKALRFE